MKASTFPLFTQKNEPSDAEIVSHKLMIKAAYPTTVIWSV